MHIAVKHISDVISALLCSSTIVSHSRHATDFSLANSHLSPLNPTGQLRQLTPQGIFSI
jgi:hypothetical protein